MLLRSTVKLSAVSTGASKLGIVLITVRSTINYAVLVVGKTSSLIVISTAMEAMSAYIT